jgi:hypothetical protein
MLGGHDIRVGRLVYFNMRVGKDVESFRTNHIDTVAVIESKISIKEIIDGAERQVVKIVILIGSGRGEGGYGGTRRRSNR